MDQTKYASMTQLIRITTSYFCCGIVVKDNFCIEAAPIMRWAVGKDWDTIRLWVETKGGEWQIL